VSRFFISIMATSFRKSPPVCLFISLFRLLTGRLRLSKQYSGCSVKMEDGSVFRIFRHIQINRVPDDPSAVVFIVSFKFAHLSHKANKLASIIPMLLITGFPGFITKIYAVNKKNGYWQGMYQWKSEKHLNDYKESFVYLTMNKRAIESSIKSFEFKDQNLIEFIENHRK